MKIKVAVLYKCNGWNWLIKPHSLLILTVFLTCSAYGQQLDSTLIKRVDSLTRSTKQKAAVLQAKVDSLNAVHSKWKDSTELILKKLESFPASLDTMRLSAKIDSLRIRLESLSATDKLILTDPQLRSVDSLKEVLQLEATQITSNVAKTMEQIQHSLDSLQKVYFEKATNAMNQWSFKNPHLQSYQGDLLNKLDWNVPALTPKFPEFAPDFKLSDIMPELKLEGLDLDLDQIDKLNLQAPDLQFLQAPKLEKLKEIQQALVKVKGITQQFKSYKAELDSLRKGDYANSQKLQQLAEQQLMQREEIQVIKEHEAELERLKQLQKDYVAKAEEYRDPERLMAEAKSKAQTVATDELLSQAEPLTSAQNKLAKAKRKYGEFQSINNLPRRPKDEIREQPFRNRLYPGITLQFAKKDDYSTLYLAPQFYYRISSHWDTGIGGIVNVNFNDKAQWVPDHDLWGYKAFVNYRFFKSFYFRVEGERVNQELPDNQADETYQRWTNILLAGIGKEFAISRRFLGQTILLFNYKEMEFNPYTSRIVLRVGIDFSLKKDQRRQFIRGLKIPKV